MTRGTLRRFGLFRNYMGRDIFQQQMELCVGLKMFLVFAESELQARRGKTIEIS